jgi:twitching motility protein PilT
MSLLKRGLITYEEALRQSTNPDDFALRMKGIMSSVDSKWDDFETVPQASGKSEAEDEGEGEDEDVRLATQGIEKY